MRQRIDTDRGLLVIEYDGALVDAVGAALGDLKSQRFKVLKNAVNATARYVSPSCRCTMAVWPLSKVARNAFALLPFWD